MSTGDFKTDYNGTVVKFHYVGIPPELQERFDALTEERKVELMAEFEAALDALYAENGLTRRVRT